jgi:hypothetical protein
MSPTRAAIVPARGVAATVAVCVADLRNGAVAPRQVHAVDDGSSDGTAAAALVAVLAFMGLLVLNLRFYSCLCNVRGPGFLGAAILWHLLYDLYGSLTFAVCLAPRRSPTGGRQGRGSPT